MHIVNLKMRALGTYEASHNINLCNIVLFQKNTDHAMCQNLQSHTIKSP